MKRIILAVCVLILGCQQQSRQPAKEQSLTQAQTAGATLEKVKADIQELKMKLAPEGKYACCIDEPCNYCLLHEGECDCAKDLQKGERVCIECYSGWQQGKGNIPKIKKEEVKTDFVEHKH